MSEKIWEEVSKSARRSALRARRIHKNLVSVDDVYQHLHLWAIEHWNKLEEWDGQDSLSFKLRRTFNNEAQKYAAKERAQQSKSPVSDSFYYTPEILHELLRDVWNYEGWLDSPDMSSEYVAKSSKPSEGNNRLAMFSDVAHAIARLNDADRLLLKLRYADGGVDFSVLAQMYEITEEAMRKRVQRAITKLQERLGGEPPIWYGRRQRKSNAQAIAELKENE